MDIHLDAYDANVPDRSNDINRESGLLDTEPNTQEPSTDGPFVCSRQLVVNLGEMYGTCESDSDCIDWDIRLSCVKDAASKQNLCLPREKESTLVIFPLTAKGKTTKRTFLIRSVGECPLKIEDISLAPTSSRDFKLVTQTLQLPFILSPNQERAITVEYTSSDDQEDIGQVWIHSNASSHGQITVALASGLPGCNLEVSPRVYGFRATKPPLTVTLLNRGNLPCIVKKVALKSNTIQGVFTLSPLIAPNQRLVPKGSLQFLVNFNPVDSKTHNDQVIIDSTDPDEPTIHLDLIGTLAEPWECDLKINPTQLSFGLVGIGRSKQQTISLLNTGWSDCILRGINPTGTIPSGNQAFYFASKVPVPLVVKSGDSMRLEVAYAPTQEANHEAKLNLQSNHQGHTNIDIPLTGSSGKVCFEVWPDTFDLGPSKFGCATPMRKFQVFNLGVGKCPKSLNITKIALTPETSSEFRMMYVPGTPKTLTAGEGLEVGLSYKPVDLGPDTGILEIDSDQLPVRIPLSGEGINADVQKDQFKQHFPAVDVMFVIDDSSCSMSTKQLDLANHFTSFLQWATRLQADYQIMVTSTDANGRSDAGCARGSTPIITPQTPNSLERLQTLVRVGINGSPFEQGLQAAYQALIPPASTNCNRGFYREDASLSIIFVSDDDDKSPHPVQFYTHFFKSLKGLRNANRVQVSLITGPSTQDCLDSNLSRASAAPRYWQLSKEFNGVQESICDPNQTTVLSRIGGATFGIHLQNQFFLSRQADPKTIVVKVNGSSIKEDALHGWQYDASHNYVSFSKSQIPPLGATIQIEYKVDCLP